MIDDTRVDALVDRYEELRARGIAVSVAELCGECRDLQKEVERRIQRLEAMNALLGTGVDEGASASTPAPSIDAGARPSPPAGALSTGSRYRVVRFHARGGLGEVFRAEDEGLHREVALKCLQPLHARNPQSRSRFLREADITGRLEHPNIVPIHAVGQDAEGRPFYAMRFVEGSTLHHAIGHFHAHDRPDGDPSKRRLAWRELVSRFVAVCNTVAYAHSRGVIHRDIKPDNILLGPYGQTLLLDWGLAKQAAGEARETLSEGVADEGRLADDGLRTEAGTVIGTPAYMSPEQAAGRWDLVGPAGDVYSLGATLYALLSGQPPVQGRQVGEVLDKVKRGDFPPPRQRKPDVPRALESICLKAMARRPEERYATALALAADLEHWLADEPVGAWREPWTVRARRWLGRHRTLVTSAAAASVVAVAGLTLGLVLLAAANDRERVARVNAETKGIEAQEQRDKAAARFRMAREAVDRFHTQVSESSEFKDYGLEPLRQKLLEAAAEFYRRLVAEEPNDLSLRVEQGRAFQRLGDLYHQLGRDKQAEEAYHQALAVVQPLAEAHPQEVSFQRDLAGCHLSLGNFYYLLKQMDRAEAAHRQVLAIRQQLAAEHPADPVYQAELAAAYTNMGDWFQDTRQTDQAEEFYRQSLGLYLGLVRDQPAADAYQIGLAKLYQNLGKLHRYTHPLEQVANDFRRALDIWDRLAQADAGVIDYQIRKAELNNNLGAVYSQYQQWNEVQNYLEEALRIRQALVKAHPARTDLRHRLGRSYNNLGRGYSESGRVEKAEQAFRQGLALNEELVREHPNNRAYAMELGQSCALLGNVLRERDPEDSLHWYDRAIAIEEAVVKVEPQYAEARLYVSYHYAGRAQTLTDLGHLDKAIQNWDRALAGDVGTMRGRWQLGRALAQVRGGNHQEATAVTRELVAAKAAGETLYEAARIYSLAAAAARRDTRLAAAAQEDLAAQYGDRAMALLGRARGLGYFKAPERIAKLKNPDFEPLRARPDFRELLSDLEGATTPNPTVKEEGSPPLKSTAVLRSAVGGDLQPPWRSRPIR